MHHRSLLATALATRQEHCRLAWELYLLAFLSVQGFLRDPMFQTQQCLTSQPTWTTQYYRICSMEWLPLSGKCLAYGLLQRGIPSRGTVGQHSGPGSWAVAQ